MGHYSNLRTEEEENYRLASIEEQMREAANLPTTDSLLNERGSRYGEFATLAALSQTLKNTIMQHYFAVHGQENAPPLPAYMAEAISMICHKLARIANGDPTYLDNWRDIIGFSELTIRELKHSKGTTDSKVTTTTFNGVDWT